LFSIFKYKKLITAIYNVSYNDLFTNDFISSHISEETEPSDWNGRRRLQWEQSCPKIQW